MFEDKILKYIDVNEVEMLKFCSYLDSISEYEMSDVLQYKIAQPKNKFVKTASFQKIANASFEENVFRFAKLYSQYLKDTNNFTPIIKIAAVYPDEAIYEALKTLGFDEVRSYTLKEIKIAYRALSKIHHPDVVKGNNASQQAIDAADELFKKIANAKDILESVAEETGNISSSKVQTSFNAFKVKMSGSGSKSGPKSSTETPPKSGPKSSPRSGPSSETPPRSGPRTSPGSGPRTSPGSGSSTPPRSGPAPSAPKAKLTPEIFTKILERLKLPPWAIAILNSKVLKFLGWVGLGYGTIMILLNFAENGWDALSSPREKAEFTSILTAWGSIAANVIPPPVGQIISAALATVSFGTGVASWFLKGDEPKAAKPSAQQKPTTPTSAPKPQSKPTYKPQSKPTSKPSTTIKPTAPDSDTTWSNKVDKEINNIVFD